MHQVAWIACWETITAIYYVGLSPVNSTCKIVKAPCLMNVYKLDALRPLKQIVEVSEISRSVTGQRTAENAALDARPPSIGVMDVGKSATIRVVILTT